MTIAVGGTFSLNTTTTCILRGVTLVVVGADSMLLNATTDFMSRRLKYSILYY